MTDVERVERTCAKCGETDSHAHHVQFVAINHPVTRQGTDLSVSKHVQCCAEDGCEICQVSVKHAQEALGDIYLGDRFNEFMGNPPREYLQELFEEQGITSAEFEEEPRPT